MGAMLTLCALWGFQQVAIKLAIMDIPPLWQSAMRSFGATVFIGLWIVLAKERWTPGLRGAGVVVGALFALEFGLLYFALRNTDAARAVLFLYTAPFVVAVGAHFQIKGERLSLLGWLGVAVAFFGTGVVVHASLALDSERIVGDLCALSAGIAWGVTTLVVRTTGLSDAAPSQTLFYQLAVSAVLLCLVALVLEGPPRAPQTLIGWSSITYQTIVVATLSYLGWFALVTRYSVTKLSVFTFLAPLLGALAGFVFLDEHLDARYIIALACVISGIVVVNAYGHSESVGEIHHEQG